jgi:alkanesulfonate monooxygenase SsuD/methylene tetrahydromethanopterin reductase-like flavin-dependent oxidoreductase (luciferase family)
MRFGLMLPSFSFARDYATVARLRDFATRAEAMGFEGLWVAEHLLTARGLYGTAWLSPLETLAFAAGCTSRIRIGTCILIPPIRNPVFLAKEIASLHMLSGGRYELGVGVGWDAREFAVAGVKLSERGGRTDEMLDIFANHAAAVGRRRVEDQDRFVARSRDDRAERAGAHLPPRRRLDRARRRVERECHFGLAADNAQT